MEERGRRLRFECAKIQKACVTWSGGSVPEMGMRVAGISASHGLEAGAGQRTETRNQPGQL